MHCVLFEGVWVPIEWVKARSEDLRRVPWTHSMVMCPAAAGWQ